MRRQYIKETLPEQAFWMLLRGGLWADEAFVRDSPALTAKEWGELVDIARSASVDGIVIDALGLLPDDKRPPMALMMDLLRQRAKLIKRHGTHNAMIHELMAMCREAGVPVLLLKGQGVAQCYGQPNCRSCGDIDIYAGVTATDRLLEAMKRRGITYEEEIDDGYKHAVFFYKDVAIEVHRRSLSLIGGKADDSYQKWWEDGLKKCGRLYATADGRMLQTQEEGSETVLVAATEQNAFFLFYHAYRHLASEMVKFKQFGDLARFLYTHKDTLDKSVLLKQLKAFGLLRKWQLVGTFLHLHLGMEKDDIPFYNDKMERKSGVVFERLRRKCLYDERTVLVRPKNRLLRKLHTYWHLLCVFAELLPDFPREALWWIWQTSVGGIRNLAHRDQPSAVENYRLRRCNATKS